MGPSPSPAGFIGGKHLVDFLPSHLEGQGIESYLDQYESHILNTFQTTAQFYEEILGPAVAQQEVVDGGDLGVFRIGSLCGWLSVLVLEIFLVVMSLRFLRSCWRDRKCWFLFYFFLFGCVTIFFFSTRRTQDEITSQLFNMNASEYVPLPELTQEDPVPLSSLSLIFHSIYVALDATWDAGKLWSVAVLLVLSPIIRLTVAVMIVVGPILKDVLKRLGEMFLAQDPMNIYLEIGTVVAVVLLWLLKRHIQRARYVERLNRWSRQKYDNFLTQVRQKSRTVARLLPHLLLIVPVVAFVYFLPDMASAISGGWLVVLVSLMWPLIRSVRSIAKKDEEEMGAVLMYWVILAFPMGVVEVLDVLPFVGRVVGFIPFLSEICFLVLLWLLLPMTDGVSVFYNMLVSVLDRYVKVGPGLVSEEQKGMLTNTLPALVGGNIGMWIRSLLEAGVLLIGFVFFITPGFMTALGVVFVSLAVPVYYSITSIGKWRKSLRRRGKASASGKPVEEVGDIVQFRLIYWVIAMPLTALFILLEQVGIYQVPGWYHFKLGLFLWLQFPMLGGAENLYARFSSILMRVGVIKKPGEEGEEKGKGQEKDGKGKEKEEEEEKEEEKKEEEIPFEEQGKGKEKEVEEEKTVVKVMEMEEQIAGKEEEKTSESEIDEVDKKNQ